MSSTAPSYTVNPPPFGFHLCYERTRRIWCAFWDAKRVATGETAWACRDAYDRWDTKRNAPQIRRLPCGRYELRVRGTARGVYETRGEARAAAKRWQRRAGRPATRPPAQLCAPASQRKEHRND